MSDQAAVLVCPPDHKHAEKLTCYAMHRCRCADCVAHHRLYLREYNASRRPSRKPRREPRTLSTGTVRRLRGLVVIGYSPERIATELKVDPSLVWYVLLAPPLQVTERFAKRVRTLFQRLSISITEDRSAELARRVATNLGWPSAFSYHDIDTSPEPRP